MRATHGPDPGRKIGHLEQEKAEKSAREGESFQSLRRSLQECKACNRDIGMGKIRVNTPQVPPAVTGAGPPARSPTVIASAVRDGDQQQKYQGNHHQPERQPESHFRLCEICGHELSRQEVCHANLPCFVRFGWFL